jgi:hypothetical protein
MAVELLDPPHVVGAAAFLADFFEREDKGQD